MIPDVVVSLISDLVRTKPGDLVRAAAGQIEATADMPWPQARNAILPALPNAELRQCVGQLLDAWQRTSPQVSRQALAYALAAAAQAAAATRREQEVALVWTGPRVDDPPLRRTDQALQEVINAARRELLLVSFAVYMVPHIAKSLVAAAQRGVTIRIALETPHESAGRIDYDTVRSLGPDVAQHAELYIWPEGKREQGAVGESGRAARQVCGGGPAAAVYLQRESDGVCADDQHGAGGDDPGWRAAGGCGDVVCEVD